MPRISHSVSRLVAVGFLALFIGGHAGRESALAQEGKEADWKAVVPPADVPKLVDESAKIIADAMKSQANFNLKAKAAENEAYLLVIYAQAGIKGGDPDLAKKAATLAEAAQGFAAAAKDKNFDDAKKHAEVIARFKTMKPDGAAKMDDVPLGKAIPLKSLMENVNNTNKELIKHNRLTAAAFNVKGKPETVALDSQKMAALTMAISAHVPEKEEKNMTKKAWLEAAEAVRTATVEMTTAAKAKKQSDWKTAFRKMDSACTKCHDVFRVDVN